ncbi:uncharacterized protein LOC141906689 [Tubulanus polymorphus]|uniref:uncharacterized protein LOC141906689 n=1 Tax=Tubulanus polymorphus TaxID=672921 RepID=UPI003DA3826F
MMVEISSIQWRGLLITVCLILVYHLQICSSSKDCLWTGGCKCKMSDGSGFIDLSSIDSNNPHKPAFSVKNEFGDATYYYNPCTPFTLGDLCKDVVVCEQRNFYLFGEATAPASWVYIEETQRIVLKYYSTLGFSSTEVTLICTDSQFTELNVIDDVKFPTKMELSGKSVCLRKQGA